jgi:tetratricopeptide (TPR) repeat protein
MRLFCIIAILLLAATPKVSAQGSVGARSLESTFEAANLAASRGDYSGAVSNYRRLIESGVHDPDVYFNLATTFAQSGDYARGILYFERAITLRPNDAKASENLRAAEQALEELRAENEGEATIQRSSSISDAVYGGISEDVLAYALLLGNLVFFMGLTWASLRGRRKAWLYSLLATSAIVLLFCAVGLGAKAGLFRDGPRAVAIDDHVILREGPDRRARARGEARAGDRFEVVDKDGDFVKLQAVGGLEGWTANSSIGFIDPEDGVH